MAGPGYRAGRTCSHPAALLVAVDPAMSRALLDPGGSRDLQPPRAHGDPAAGFSVRLLARFMFKRSSPASLM